MSPPLQASHPYRPLWLAIVVVVAIGGGTFVVRAVEKSQALVVKNVVVRGQVSTTAEMIRAFAEVKPGTALFSVDLEAVERRVTEHPFVKSATVRRLPPDEIEIELQERVARAVMVYGSPYLVDAEGVPFKRVAPGDDVDLVVLSGDLTSAEVQTDGREQTVLRPQQVKLALRAVGAWEQAETQANDVGLGPLDEVSFLDGAGIRLVLRNGLAVHLGLDHFGAKLARLFEVVERLHARGHEPTTVFLDDDRQPERVAVRLRGAPEVAVLSGT